MTESRPGVARCLVVANPAAGSAVASFVDRTVGICERHARQVRLYWTRAGGADVEVVAGRVGGSGEAGGAEWVRRAPGTLPGLGDRRSVSLVVTVGGDGTVRDVAEGLMRGLGRWQARGAGSTPWPAWPGSQGVHAAGSWALFVVPAGTGNSVYRALWEDRPWPETLEAVLGLDGQIIDIDVGQMAGAGEAVVLGASAGFLAEVVREARSMPGVAGRERYQAAAAAALATHAPFPGRVEVDGEVCGEGSMSLVAIGGGRYRGGGIDVLPRSVLDDGLLDVCVVASSSRERLVELALLAAEGRHLSEPEVAYRQGRSIVLDRTDAQPLVFEHDGDLSDVGSRVTVEMRQHILPVLTTSPANLPGARHPA